MRYLILLLIFITIPAAAAEWLVCDVPPESENVVGYWVSHDAEPVEPPQWVEYQVVVDPLTGKQGARLYDITGVPDGTTFTVMAQNDQGRRSEPSNPFVLGPRPSGIRALWITKQ